MLKNKMFQAILFSVLVVGRAIATNETVSHFAVHGLGLREYYTPLGDQENDLLFCAQAALANNSKVYELNGDECRCSLPNLTRPQYLINDRNATIYLNFPEYSFNSGNCSLELPSTLNRYIKNSISADGWAEWSTCDSPKPCGGGWERRRFWWYQNNRLKTDEKEYEQARACNNVPCQFPEPPCNANYKEHITNDVVECLALGGSWYIKAI